ncbi:TrgA family protein [Pacificibacter marinus]|uniref:Tellurium resistance protein n=1 Tax=Pacificibacter marinus TaxID=658057 RepID=A0A1Y5T0W2_9RHOB|nr:TrgA family protein [Pacificibacter marinus]SEK97191.1 hypothetical protein SAMN04488032_10932 [Pacificibacter marinus]SLN53437.1 hypothetical protein PAM7971_02722 [Pacificibacter marinus]
MPTASKLAAFLWYALVAWFSAQLLLNYLPLGVQTGYFTTICAVFGGFIGWTFAGARAGDTMSAAYGYGLTTVILIVLCCVFYFSVEEMLHRSLRNRYGGLLDALTGCVSLMEQNFVLLFKYDVVIVLIFGGMFGGFLVEKVARKWS